MMDKKMNLRLLQLFSLAMLLFSGMVYAIPTPQGIDGIVFSLDNVTQAPDKTSYSITNLETGKVIEGVTGMGNQPGRYSAAVEGITGDRMLVQAWTASTSVNRTVNLTGSMHNVNLYLDVAVPPPGFEGKPVPSPFAHLSSGEAPDNEVGEIEKVLSRPQDYAIESKMVPPLMIIDGVVVRDGQESGKIIVENQDTGEQVIAKTTRTSGRRTGFRAGISGKRGDTVRILQGDAVSEELPYGLDQEGIIIESTEEDTSTEPASDRPTGMLRVSGWAARDEPGVSEDAEEEKTPVPQKRSDAAAIAIIALAGLILGYGTYKRRKP